MAAKPASLAHGVSTTFLGIVAYTASQFCMLILAARLTNTTDVGRYGLALAITAPIFLFFDLKLRHVLVTDSRGDNTLADFIGTRICSSFIALTVTAASALLFQLDPYTSLLLVAVAAGKAMEGQIDVLYGALQRRSLLQVVAYAQTIRAFGGLAAFATGLVVGGNVLWASLALALFTGAAIPIVACLARRQDIETGVKFRPRRIQRLAILALPLGISVSVGALMINAPRYVIERQIGIDELGIFTALSYTLVASGTVANAMVEAVSPRMADLHAAGRHAEFSRLLGRFTKISLGLGIAGVVGTLLFGRQILSIMFGPEYGDRAGVLVVLMVGAAISYCTLPLGTALNAMRLFRVQVPINLLGLAVVVPTALWLTPLAGLTGAAFAVGISQSVQGLAYLYLYLSRIRSTIP